MFQGWLQLFKPNPQTLCSNFVTLWMKHGYTATMPKAKCISNNSVMEILKNWRIPFYQSGTWVPRLLKVDQERDRESCSKDCLKLFQFVVVLTLEKNWDTLFHARDKRAIQTIGNHRRVCIKKSRRRFNHPEKLLWLVIVLRMLRNSLRPLFGKVKFVTCAQNILLL